jgi:molybdenum cofactor guanylyltransferase
MTAMRVAGLVLAGGQSRRFGAEKAAALLAGRPLLAWSIAALAQHCERVAVSAAPGSQAEALAAGRPVLRDDLAHPRGPLAGVAAGLTWAAALGFEHLATLPCDTPLVGPGEIAALIGAASEAPAVHAACAGEIHGLCAVWRTDLGPWLSQRLRAGDHPSVRALHAELGAAAVQFACEETFRNTNHPADLALLEERLRSGGSGLAGPAVSKPRRHR